LNCFSGKDFLIEALKYHLLKGEQKIMFKSPRIKPRQPVGLPKVLLHIIRLLPQETSLNLSFIFQVMLVVGGQAPKAIRSVECYDFKEERWYQVAEMPSRRCR
jgi:kelch-like protein 2/3